MNVIDRYRVSDGRRFDLAGIDPEDTAGIDSKEAAQERLARGTARLAKLQEVLYAQDRWALLVVLQALDAAGKDGTIEHVMSGVNPTGVQVVSFKAPSDEELDHDWMWRCVKALPERGRIGIFNRSYYEEVLVVRVHEEILAGQKLPAKFVTKRIFDERFEDIRAHERYWARNGIAIVKFFLHVSKAEQKARLLARLNDPEKSWKFDLRDVEERVHFERYQRCFEQAVRETAAEHAPWYVVPADKKWFTRLVVAEALVDALERLDLAFPKVDGPRKQELAAARQRLEGS
jgi:PPK2 family polyphosphate:nucleotide phosphotransferase